MNAIEEFKNIISISILAVTLQGNFLYAQNIDNQSLSAETTSDIFKSKYMKLVDLRLFTDRNPEIYKIDRMLIGKPTDYWFNVAVGLPLETYETRTKVEYIRYGIKEKVVSEKDSISQFDVYLNSDGIIDSIATLNHYIELASKERVIEILKTCQWKPALSSLKPVNVNFVLEIKFTTW